MSAGYITIAELDAILEARGWRLSVSFSEGLYRVCVVDRTPTRFCVPRDLRHLPQRAPTLSEALELLVTSDAFNTPVPAAQGAS